MTMDTFPIRKNILFFDGVCHLCNGYIDFLVPLDHERKIFYASLQGKTASDFLTSEQRQNFDSILYFKNGKILNKSKAVIESLGDVSFWFFWIKILYVIPEFIRNLIYDLIAKNRYKLFGRSDFCRVPTAEEREYLLD